MITLKQIVDKIKQVASANLQVGSVHYGDIGSLNEGQQLPTPAVVIELTGAASSKAQITYSVQVTVLDIEDTSKANQLLIHSKTMDIANDIINEFVHGSFVIPEATSPFTIEQDIALLPIAMVDNNAMVGWQFTLEVSAFNARSGCATPYQAVTFEALYDSEDSQLFDINNSALLAISAN
jgi:hypothetical protein